MYNSCGHFTTFSYCVGVKHSIVVAGANNYTPLLSHTDGVSSNRQHVFTCLDLRDLQAAKERVLKICTHQPLRSTTSKTSGKSTEYSSQKLQRISYFLAVYV